MIRCVSWMAAAVLVCGAASSQDETRTIAAGERQLASYGVQGLNRRWDFGSNLNYSFTIDVKGAGEYYDFSNIEPGETTQASMVLDCVQESTP